METLELERLFTTYGLQDSDLYFLDLIPLVEMIWADGCNQEGELQILEDFARRHMTELNRILGYPMVTERHLNRFLDRFARRRPSPRLLAALRDIACERLRQRSAPADEERIEAILECCLDIAAACVTRYPYGLQERIMEGERRLLMQLFDRLRGREASPK
ncbi:hypothetical protein MIN45_P1605 [Methylomarinovum tepidoasis]|uniref:TetR family transcriptional regulator n=1 Tax=Methylomarinovum tepidoasis TaxID=2840183 RepID=A0AAU9C9X0_9GAMM|nr:hypothetical protein [Methylomarinovum sp. IN45]BCX89235.1 hypothetical protein MIN45_P1605 [Methylomarinovum sp. IN45]